MAQSPVTRGWPGPRTGRLALTGRVLVVGRASGAQFGAYVGLELLDHRRNLAVHLFVA